MQKSAPPPGDQLCLAAQPNGAGHHNGESPLLPFISWAEELMRLIPKRTRKAVRKTVKKAIRRHGPEIATAIVTGVVTSVFAATEDNKKKKKKKKR